MADKFPNPQVGDPVAYYGRSTRNGCPSARMTIERVTATQIVVLEAVFSGRLAPEIARWEPIGPRGKHPGEPRTCSAHGDFEPCPECKRIRDRREP